MPTRGAIPLGIDAGAEFSAEVLDLGHGETLLLYSDGVIEQRAADGTVFGRDGLVAAVAAARDPAAAMSAALGALHAHAGDARPDDDTSLLALARAAAAAST